MVSWGPGPNDVLGQPTDHPTGRSPCRPTVRPSIQPPKRSSVCLPARPSARRPPVRSATRPIVHPTVHRRPRPSVNHFSNFNHFGSSDDSTHHVGAGAGYVGHNTVGCCDVETCRHATVRLCGAVTFSFGYSSSECGACTDQGRTGRVLPGATEVPAIVTCRHIGHKDLGGT